MSFEDELKSLWKERVDSRFVYRGMSAKDLIDPLDPARDPFEGMCPGILNLMDMLQGLVDAGFEFRLREEHFGDVCWHDLGNIVQWTRQDLDDAGIDFTSHHAAAREYSDCYQGSQLKQNLKYITDHLPGHAKEPSVTSRLGEKEWTLVSEINAWVNSESPNHRSIVLRVRRSCPAFDGNDLFLPVGTFDTFRERALSEVRKAGLPENIEGVEKLLPDEERGFDYRLRRPLGLEHIEEIQEVLTERLENIPARELGKP